MSHQWVPQLLQNGLMNICDSKRTFSASKTHNFTDTQHRYESWECYTWVLLPCKEKKETTLNMNDYRHRLVKTQGSSLGEKECKNMFKAKQCKNNLNLPSPPKSVSLCRRRKSHEAQLLFLSFSVGGGQKMDRKKSGMCQSPYHPDAHLFIWSPASAWTCLATTKNSELTVRTMTFTYATSIQHPYKRGFPGIGLKLRQCDQPI